MSYPNKRSYRGVTYSGQDNDIKILIQKVKNVLNIGKMNKFSEFLIIIYFFYLICLNDIDGFFKINPLNIKNLKSFF